MSTVSRVVKDINADTSAHQENESQGATPPSVKPI